MDSRQLAALVRQHQHELYRYVRYLGAADRATAEDIVQETFLAAHRSLPPQAQDASGQAAWLRGIARHKFLTRLRQSRKTVTLDAAALAVAESIWVVETAPSEDERLEALRACLARLPARQRALLEERYAARASRTAMAKRYGLSAEGVKSALRRLRAHLADCIRRRMEHKTP